MNDSPLYLAKPDLVHYDAYRAMREEWLADGSQLSPWFLNLPVNSIEDFARLVKQLNDAQFANADPGYCTTTSYLVFDRAGTLVGASSLRHYLTLEGIRYFGHIGYGIRPGQRRKGYAKEVLRLMLAEAKRMKLYRVLLGAHDTNVGSCKTIEACGGVLENIVPDPEDETQLVKRYWIDIQPD